MNEKFIESLTKEELNDISKQMEKKYICKIYTKDGFKGIGFFCIIDLDNY